MKWFMVEVKTPSGWVPAGNGLGSVDQDVAEDYCVGIAKRHGQENCRVTEYGPPAMTKEELVEALEGLRNETDNESAHHKADSLLTQFINDPEVTAAFDAVRKWYA